MAAPPALRSACAHGDGGAVRELLRRGESASGLYDERSGETLLFVAAQHGHSAVCDELLDGGAHAYVNKARFIDDATPLHMAAGKGHAAVVRALLRCRAVVDRADSRAGRTPLFHAASRGQLEAAQLLLGAGADANWLDQQGIVPLYAAAQNGETQVLAALLRAGAAVNGVPAQPPPGSRRRPAPAFVPLHAAAKHGHAAAARQLLRAGADPLLCTANGQTALWIAAQHGHAELAAMLLSACAGAVGRPATDGATPLLAAAAAGHAHCCELLLRYRADPSAADERGTTPMAAALKKGRSAHVAVVTALLDAGCAAPSHEVRASVADRSMSGLLSLSSSRGLVSATQRLAWAKLPMAAAVVAAGRTSGGWRAAVTPRGRRRRASAAAARRAPPRLSAALIAHVASRMHAPSIHTATRAAEVSASQTLLADWLVLAVHCAPPVCQESARQTISVASASQNPAVVGAVLARLRSDETPPVLQHALSAELAQLQASLGQLQHQEFRRSHRMRIACCGARPSEGNPAVRAGSVRRMAPEAHPHSEAQI